MSDSRTDSDSTLRRLSDAHDFEVAENEPDIRGWDVVLSDGTKIGEVDDLMVDTTMMKAAYIDIDLDRTALGLDDSRHALAPVARADLDTEQKHVVLLGIDRQGVLQ